eukprot:RCo000288
MPLFDSEMVPFLRGMCRRCLMLTLWWPLGKGNGGSRCLSTKADSGGPAPILPDGAVLRVSGGVLTAVLTAVKAVGVPYALALLALYAAQQSLLYPVPMEIADPEATGGKLYRISLDPESPPTVVVLYFAPPSASAPVLAYFHGNGDQLGWGAAELGRMFAQHGCGFFSVEYPGYGLARRDCPGGPSEARIYTAAHRALDFLDRK